MKCKSCRPLKTFNFKIGPNFHKFLLICVHVSTEQQNYFAFDKFVAQIFSISLCVCVNLLRVIFLLIADPMHKREMPYL